MVSPLWAAIHDYECTRLMPRFLPRRWTVTEIQIPEEQARKGRPTWPIQVKASELVLWSEQDEDMQKIIWFLIVKFMTRNLQNEIIQPSAGTCLLRLSPVTSVTRATRVKVKATKHFCKSATAGHWWGKLSWIDLMWRYLSAILQAANVPNFASLKLPRNWLSSLQRRPTRTEWRHPLLQSTAAVAAGSVGRMRRKSRMWGSGEWTSLDVTRENVWKCQIHHGDMMGIWCGVPTIEWAIHGDCPYLC